MLIANGADERPVSFGSGDAPGSSAKLGQKEIWLATGEFVVWQRPEIGAPKVRRRRLRRFRGRALTSWPQAHQ